MGAEITTDKLLLEIELKEKNVANKVSKLAKGVDALQSSLLKLNTKELNTKFNSFTRTMGRLNVDGLSNLANNFSRIGTALKSITKTDFDTSKLYKKFSSLTRIIQPFVAEMKKAENSLIALQSVLRLGGAINRVTSKPIETSKIHIDLDKYGKQLSKIETKTQNVNGDIITTTKHFNAQNKEVGSLIKTVDKYGKVTEIATGVAVKGSKKNSSGGLWDLGKTLASFYVVTKYAQRLGRFMADIVQHGIDYTESLNMWQVAMRGNVEQADKFVKKMANAYGFATETIMRYQATFKNMLSSLGGVTDIQSVQLSEFLTQMAVDYASLYNTSIQKAMQTFQSVLSGQVRPIRSISGYDITETTIYELYQRMGGTKTMRQLTQLEKRLLRIYAVFEQMYRSGVIGDLNRTFGRTANQARVLSEQVKQLFTNLGVLINNWLEKNQILPKVNALLITINQIIGSISKTNDTAKEISGADVFGGTEESATNAQNAVDELNGSLLSFDKFEVLDKSADTEFNFGIDQTVLDIGKKYESLMDNLQQSAIGFAKQWYGWLYDFDKGELTAVGQELVSVFKGLSTTFAVLIGYQLTKKATELASKITGIKDASQLLNAVLVSGIIYSFARMIDEFKQGNIWGGILAGAIGVTLAGAFIYLNRVAIISLIKTIREKLLIWLTSLMFSTGGVTSAIWSMSASFIGLGVAIFGAFAIITNWADMNTWQRILGIVGVATTAILGLAFAFGAFHSAWSIGLASAGIVAGITAIVTSIATVKKEINAGDIQSYDYNQFASSFSQSGASVGSYASATYTPNVSAQDALTQSNYSAMMAYNSQGGSNGGTADVYLDGKKVGVAVAKHSYDENVRSGLIKANRG